MRTARAAGTILILYGDSEGAGTILKVECDGAVVEIRQCMEEYGMVEQIKSLECDD